MATREENRIIQYIAQEGSITRLECEAIDVPLHIFMDCIASLNFRGWVTSDELVRKSESGRDMIINEYKFTKLFKHQSDTYLKYINQQS